MRKYIAECIGTFVLVAFGCGAAVAANTIFVNMGSPIPIAFTTLLIAFAFGLTIVAMAYSIGNVSGCHVNPAVSLGMLISGRMGLKDFAGYLVGQFLGAVLAALFLMQLFGGRDSLGANGYGQYSAFNTSMVGALGLEIVLTFVFVLVVLGVTSRREFASVAGLVIGLSLTLVHIFGIPFTGTSVNPARSFGPAIVSGGDALKQLPVFIIAPLIGGALAAVVYRFLLATEEKDDSSVLETLAAAFTSGVSAGVAAEEEPEDVDAEDEVEAEAEVAPDFAPEDDEESVEEDEEIEEEVGEEITDDEPDSTEEPVDEIEPEEFAEEEEETEEPAEESEAAEEETADEENSGEDMEEKAAEEEPADVEESDTVMEEEATEEESADSEEESDETEEQEEPEEAVMVADTQGAEFDETYDLMRGRQRRKTREE